MNVEETHEDGDHQPLVVEVFVFLHFLNHYDLAVGRSHDDAFGIFKIEITDGAAVEVEHNAPNGQHNDEKQPKRPLCIETVPQRHRDKGDEDKAIGECIVSLTVNAYILYFSYFLSHWAFWSSDFSSAKVTFFCWSYKFLFSLFGNMVFFR